MAGEVHPPRGSPAAGVKEGRCESAEEILTGVFASSPGSLGAPIHFVVFRRAAAAMALMLALSSCATPTASTNFSEDREALIAAFRAESEAVRDKRAGEANSRIKLLQVERAAAGSRSPYAVTIDLQDAPLAEVVTRLLRQTDVSYNLSGVSLAGRVTARFKRLGLIQALDELVRAERIIVEQQGDIIVFRYGTRPGAGRSPTGQADGIDASNGSYQGDGSGPTIEVEVTLGHLSADDAVNLLDGLYSDSDALSFGALPNLNTVFLSGETSAVEGARLVLVRADREVPHIFIETLVVDLDTIATMNLGAQLTDGATGDASNINILPGNLAGNIGFTLIDGLMSPAQLTILIDLLVAENSAEVLSRPYLAARSNQQATIEIVSDQFVAVDSSEEGAAITTTDAISAGVRLNVTPVVQADGMIRLDLRVEESQFIPTIGAALVQKERNAASTSVSVPSGQTVVVGGLNFSRRVKTNSGVPFLRNVPGLNFGAADQAGQSVGRELVVYMTPRIWDPQLDSPLLLPDLPRDMRPLPADAFRD